MGSRCGPGVVDSRCPDTPARTRGDACDARAGGAARLTLRRGVLVACAALLTACAGLPLVPYSKEAPPLVLVPVAQAGVADGRARFREVFCAVLAARAAADAAGMQCEEALVRLSDEPAGTGAGVDLAASRARITLVFVPGFASDCVGQARTLSGEAKDTLARSGYGYAGLPVSGLASSAYNTTRVRDAVLRIHATDPAARVVIVAHSKGVVDTLEALVAYPELRGHVAGVISLAGAVGGSPLTNLAPAQASRLIALAPWLECEGGDYGALASLRPDVRKTWLARHPLPREVAFYSIVAMPDPERVSTGLKASYGLLSDIDPRNDGNLLHYDQVVPGSTLLAYANADHWAIATDLTRSPVALVRSFADRNGFPRASMLEAALRYLEEDLGLASRP